jgi:acyl carrier protein
MRAGHVRQIYAGIVANVGKVLLVSPDDISPATNLENDLGADSMDILEILFRLERQFGVALPVWEAASVNTLGCYLQEHVPRTALATFEI